MRAVFLACWPDGDFDVLAQSREEFHEAANGKVTRAGRCWRFWLWFALGSGCFLNAEFAEGTEEKKISVGVEQCGGLRWRRSRDGNSRKCSRLAA